MLPVAAPSKVPSAPPPPDDPWRVRRSPLAWIAPTLLAAALSWPHLFHPLHHDEIYTIEVFAVDFEHAFLHYHIPNNHILFSALFRIWRLVSDDPAVWRLMPMSFFLLAAALTAAAGRRLTGGPLGGWLCGMVFATMHPALSFGTELRGYSQSITFSALALYALVRWRDDSRRRWPLVYGISAFLGVGSVPTTLAAFAPMVCWRLGGDWFGRAPRRGLAARTAWLALTPLMGLVFLLPNWRFLEGGMKAGSSMAKSTFLWHYPVATLWDFLWLPAAAWALARLCRGRVPAPDVDGRQIDRDAGGGAWLRPALLLICAVLVPMACCLAQRRTPNDYTLSATLPMIALGLGWLAHALAPRDGRAGAAAALWLGVALAALGVWREFGAGASRNPFSSNLYAADGGAADGFNLYFQEYQNNHAPIRLANTLARSFRAYGDQNALVLFWKGDPLPVRTYWRRLHAADFPGAALLIVPDDVREFTVDDWRELWRSHPIRIVVCGFTRPLDPGFFEMVSPEDPGHLVFRKQFWHSYVYRWQPGPAPAPSSTAPSDAPP